MNRTELTSFILEHFPCREDHPWEKYPDYATFKHLENGKWFALVAQISGQNLHLPFTAAVDFVNLKNDPDLITSLRQEPGILPAYHMNKEHWLTVLLDGSVDSELVKALVETSFELTCSKKR